jgi:SET domain-containing protein
MTPRNDHPLFEIRDSPIQGKGAFAIADIPKGTRVIEYVGEVVTEDEANERYDDESMDRHHTFLFSVDENTVIDGAVNGNDAIYINHSCDPNCEPIVDDKRVFIETIRKVKKGEELFYDYGYERDEDPSVDDESLYPCRCGTAKCRGTILAPREE